MTWTWVEPFAGAAACSLRLVGGKDLVPPVSWMGGKRRYARAILDAMGVPETPPSRVLLADAGPWGWVWPLLLDPESADAVARVLRSWANEHPRDLWQRLAAQPPAKDLHERAAQWLWLQARSASGVPVWWGGWKPDHPCNTSTWSPGGAGGAGAWVPDPERAPAWLEGPTSKISIGKIGDKRAAWLASNGQGEPVPAGTKGLGGWRFAGRPDRTQQSRPAAMSGDKTLAAWRMGDERGDERGDEQGVSQKGTARGQTGGMVCPRTIADRLEAIAHAFARVAATVHHGDAQAQADAHGIPPPFKSGQVGCDCIDCDGTWCVWCLDHHGRRPCPVDEERKAHEPRVLLGKPTWVYLDPPYLGATGYGWDMPRAEVLALARRWHDAGAVVAVSEAEPLEIEGWHHVELTREGGKPEWLTLSRPPARLPERQGALFAAEDA